ncbi:hypothetical protein MMC07_008593 [Pseudocyphellaria aurata]|nr:hypothetical protein [Pseudocyphellaria aurata]
MSQEPSSRTNAEIGITDPHSPEDPPDGGYGWVCVAACFAINCFTWGVVSTYGVFLSHFLSEGLFPEATALDFAFIGGFNFSIAMLVAPLVTITTRKFGRNTPMLLGITFLSAGHFAASFASRVWQLYLSQGVLIGLGVGFTYIPSIAILSQWFQKRRSLANGISAAGSGIGGLVFSFMSEAVIKNISLAWAFRLTAIISCIMLLLATLVMRSRNKSIRPFQRGFDVRLLRRLDVQILLAWAFFSMLGYITILFSLPDFARSINLSSSQAATTAALQSFGNAVGRPLIGHFSDRFGRIETAGLLTLVCGLSCFCIWIPGTSYGATILFALINGAIFGVFWVVIGPLCVEVAGLAELPSLLSLSWLSIVLPTTFSEVIALKLRRPHFSNQYLYPQIFAGLTYLCASACLYDLHRRTRRMKDEREQGSRSS